MKKYFVKCVSVATENNRNFANKISFSLYGKEQKLLYHKGSAAEAAYTERNFDKFLAIEYGYNSMQAAKHSWIYKNPQNTEFWKSSVEIISLEI